MPSALPSPFEAPQDNRKARGAPFRCLAPVVALYASKAASLFPAPEEWRSPSGDLIFVTRIVAFMARRYLSAEAVSGVIAYPRRFTDYPARFFGCPYERGEGRAEQLLRLAISLCRSATRTFRGLQ